MKHLFTILCCVLLLAAASCKKVDETDGSKIRNVKAEAIDATTSSVEFDLYLTEEDLTRIKYEPEITVWFSAGQGDPMEMIESQIWSPRVSCEGWYRVAEEGETYPRVGKNHCSFINMNLPYSSNGYKGLIRVRLRLLNQDSEEERYDFYWGDLCEVSIPGIGVPYVRYCDISSIDQTSAKIVYYWAGNGNYIRKEGCIFSTDRDLVERKEGTSVEQSYSTIVLKDLKPGTTYYFRFWCITFDVFAGQDIETVYSDEIGSFTTL